MGRECADLRCWVSGDEDIEESGDVGETLVVGDGDGLLAGLDETWNSSQAQADIVEDIGVGSTGDEIRDGIESSVNGIHTAILSTATEGSVDGRCGGSNSLTADGQVEDGCEEASLTNNDTRVIRSKVDGDVWQVNSGAKGVDGDGDIIKRDGDGQGGTLLDCDTWDCKVQQGDVGRANINEGAIGENGDIGGRNNAIYLDRWDSDLTTFNGGCRCR